MLGRFVPVVRSGAPMAFERLTVPFRAGRILRHAGGLLVIDKPSGVVVHGGDEELKGDLVSRLAGFLSAQGEDDYVGVHQRLDQGTSGVCLFVTSRERNAEVARATEGHELGRRYVAAVDLRSPDVVKMFSGQAVRLEHRLQTEGGRSRVVERGGVHALAKAELIERVGPRALVLLTPETGRTHQLRVQLSHVGAPVGGDLDYGGAPAPRLLLHASELRLGDDSWTVPVPPSFSRFLRGEPSVLGDDEEVSLALEDAGILRAPLARVSDVYRLVNDEADGLPGVTVDRYGEFAVLHLSSAEAERRAEELSTKLVELGARGVYLKVRRRSDARRADRSFSPEAPIAGEAAPERLVVTERGIRIVVELGRGQSTGLFVDQRENRRRVREGSAGARVLNLFSYTSSFGVAAALGGASEVVSVDTAAPALARARENFRENAIDPARHRFERADALDFLARAGRRGDRFDVVVLDPPSFSSSAGGGTFTVEKSYVAAARLALSVLAPGGRLFAVTNHRKTSLGRLRKTLREAALGARVEITALRDLPSSLDCPDGVEGPVPSKSVLLTRR